MRFSGWTKAQQLFHDWRYSLTSRLLMLFLFTALLLTGLVLFVVFQSTRHHFKTEVRPLVTHYVYLFSEQIGTPPDYQLARQLTNNLPLEIHIVHNNALWTTSTIPPKISYLQHRFKHIGKHKSLLNEEFRNQNGLQPLKPPAKLRRSENGLLFHLAKNDYDFYFEINNKRMNRQSYILMLILFAILSAGFVIVFFTTCRVLKPIKDIDAGVNEYAKGNFQHHIKKSFNDQLGNLTDSVNSMAEQIKNMLESKRQLLLGISHELRSPIARSKVNLELLQQNKHVDALRQDMNLMQQLIEELIEGERLNNNHTALQLSRFNIGQLISELIQHDFVDKKIQHAIIDCFIEADMARIKLLLRNVIQNAFTHNKTDAYPKIRVTQNKTHCAIDITDHGQGIAEEHIPHLTDPFYRADPSRQRQTGGYGLGLYLCSVIVKAHHGHFKISSEVGQGTTVHIELPLLQPKSAPIDL